MTALITVIVIVVVLAAIAGAFFVLGRRDTSKAIGTLSAETKSRDRNARSTALATQDTDVAAWTPPTSEQIGVSRRQFLNRGILTMAGLSIAGFGTGLISFLWPTLSGGFGSKISLGKVSDLKAKIQAGNGFYYLPEGKLYVTTYPASALPKARQVYGPGELAGHGGRRDRALPEVPPPRLPGPAVPDLAVVRVPLPRLAVQPGR